MTAKIRLVPSFHDEHTWTVKIDDESATVVGSSTYASGQWQLNVAELQAIPDEFFTDSFSKEGDERFGLDGITVSYHIENGEIIEESSVWSPIAASSGTLLKLLRWCWDGLFVNSSDDYCRSLVGVHNYFEDWGINAQQTKDGLRISGTISILDEDQLIELFKNVTQPSNPMIDMSYYEGAGTLLYPIFWNFFVRMPESRWLVNDIAFHQMREVGIPVKSMIECGL